MPQPRPPGPDQLAVMSGITPAGKPVVEVYTPAGRFALKPEFATTIGADLIAQAEAATLFAGFSAYLQRNGHSQDEIIEILTNLKDGG